MDRELILKYSSRLRENILNKKDIYVWNEATSKNFPGTVVDLKNYFILLIEKYPQSNQTTLIRNYFCIKTNENAYNIADICESKAKAIHNFFKKDTCPKFEVLKFYSDLFEVEFLTENSEKEYIIGENPNISEKNDEYKKVENPDLCDEPENDIVKPKKYRLKTRLFSLSAFVLIIIALFITFSLSSSSNAVQETDDKNFKNTDSPIPDFAYNLTSEGASTSSITNTSKEKVEIDTVIYRTDYIFNDKSVFLKAGTDWGFPIDKKGEDMSSEFYGSIYSTQILYAKKVLPGTIQIARDSIIILFTLHNNTSESVNLKGGNIIILNTYTPNTSQIEYNIYKKRSEKEETIVISFNSQNISYFFPPDKTWLTEGTGLETGFLINSKTKDLSGKIIRFYLELELIGRSGKKYRTRSDKDYYIAFSK